MTNRKRKDQELLKGPATSEGSPAPRTFHADVAQLDAEKRQLVEQMLVEGATFEDVVEAVNERPGPAGVTLQAVQNYFRGSPDLQQRRVRHIVESIERLRNALASPEVAETADGKLARAALFTGFMGLSRAAAQLTMKDSQSLRLQHDTLKLRKRIQHHREQKEYAQRKLLEVRLQQEHTRLRKLKVELKELEQRMEESGERARLTPETLQRIQEIYGLVEQKHIPEEESVNAEARA